jgi:predicted HAD superfamily Cof-like phosphohydrolase
MLNLRRQSYDMVAEFHRTFGHPAHPQPHTINLNDPKLRKLRVQLIAHELMELAQALGVDLYLRYEHLSMSHLSGKQLEDYVNTVPVAGYPTNEVEAADALADLDVVVNGAALAFGFHLPTLTAEVHRANMSKLGADGRPLYNEDGKILKGPNYKEPDIPAVLEYLRSPATATAYAPPELTAEQAAVRDAGLSIAEMQRLGKKAQVPQHSSHDSYGPPDSEGGEQ